MFLLLAAIFLHIPFLLSLLLLHPQCCWRALPVAGVPAAAGVNAVADVLNVASILTFAKNSLLSTCPCCVPAPADIPGVSFVLYVQTLLALHASLLLLVLLLFWCLCGC
jgi:hypothetical protein